MNRRLLGLIGSILLAGIGTFVLISYVQGVEERAAAGEESVEVLVVDKPIARGEPASDIEDSLRTALVPAKVVPDDAIADLAVLGEQVTAVDLVPGEQLLSTRFATEEDLASQAKVELDPDQLQVTISLSPDRAVGGQLRPGTLVAFFASFDPFDYGSPEPGEPIPVSLDEGLDTIPDAKLRTPNSTHIILHKLIVTNVQVERLPAGLESDETPAGLELAPTGNLLVTLAVPVRDAEKVIFTAEHGTVWLAIEAEDAPTTGTGIQTRGTIY